MKDTLLKACEALIGGQVLEVKPVSGGSINHARLIKSFAGDFFIKFQHQAEAHSMFETEAKGLKELAKCPSIRVPKVFGTGQVDQTAFLLLEYLASGPANKGFWVSFGRALANLHQMSHDKYGLAYSNYIGRLPQSNQFHLNWIPFYINERIQPQVKLAFDQKRLDTNDLSSFDKLYNKFPQLLAEERPALIHGDLWSGNFLSLPQQSVALIDPAACYANREMDLAMSLLFGGFSPLFYHAYQEAFPLKEDWQDRIELYQLYYLLVHVNLFGGSYVSPVRNILDRFVA